ncbi:TonB-dependent receptor [Flavobacterium daemonense]|nr:TonB-dependent receptor [Flavobacterium daemonense]
MIAPVFVQAQSRMISGSVQDDKNDPLPGVTVSVKGTKTATITDYTGQFNIKADSKDQLVFTYISFETTTVTVGDRNAINVTLKSSTSNLEEIVVVGYGAQKRKDITGSIATVSMSDLQKAPVASFDQALAGRVAGVQVSSGDGQPGAGLNIVIRGNNSLTQSNSPLFIIDGFPIENMDPNTLNPQDIETMDILKDASATAVYGARGANGVVVITTKKGRTGKPVFAFSNSTGIQNGINNVRMMDPYEFVKLQIELNPSPTGTPPYLSPTELYLPAGVKLEDYKTSKATDWYAKVIRPAIMKTYDASFSGGTARTKYFISGNVVDQDGIMIGSNFTRYQGRITLDHQLTKKIKVGINTNYAYSESKGNLPSATGNGYTSYTMYSVWGYRPITGPRSASTNPDEELFDPDLNLSQDFRTNPVINLMNQVNNRISSNFIGNAYLDYDIITGLKLRVSGGLVNSEIRNEKFNNSKTSSGYKGSANGVNGRIDYVDTKNWLNENTLTWTKTFNKKHNLNVLGGFTMQKVTTDTHGVAYNQIKDESMGLDVFKHPNDQAYGSPVRVDPFSSVSTMLSFLTRVNYNYDSRYFLTASWRADGSSKFPSENHWGYFPSAALSWRFKNEKFLKNNKVLSDGKLRFSYGETGNNRVGDFDYKTKFFNGIGNSYVFNNEYVPGVVATNLGNDKLKWETTAQTNFGLDLGFFNQRITIIADVYRKVTDDLLLQANLPTTSGFNTAFKNVGSMENKGLELTLNTQNINNKSFAWSTSFNISFNKNKILALNDGETEILRTAGYDPSIFYTKSAVGQPLGEMYGYVFDGTYKYSDFNSTVSSTGVTTYTLKPGIITNGKGANLIQPGDIKFKDVNGDGAFDTKDIGIIGHTLPKHIGGFTNNFTYKGFDLNIFFQWSYGNDIMNANRIVFEGGTPIKANLNQFASFADRWTPSNPDSNMPRLLGTNGSIPGYNTNTIEDGSYLRLKTLSFGYNFDNDFTKKVKLKSLRIYAAAQNLITWTKYSGSDPEVSTSPSVLTGGFDYSSYPRARTVTIGLNTSF